MTKSVLINKKRIFSFKSKEEFLKNIKNKKTILVALNAEKLNNKNSELENLINNNIGYPDGIGAVFALKRKGIESVKIPGAEFWLDIIERYYKEKKFYFIGGTTTIIEQTIDKLKLQFEKINIVGYRNGFFKTDEINDIKLELQKLQPDFVFVAMGSPKQEFIMADFLNTHSALYMGLGGSFDVFVGSKKRAPKSFQNLGLEWFYRLLKEPTRFNRQINLVRFAVKIIFNRI